MTPKDFVSKLAGMQMPNVFNPYSEKCSTYDLADGAARRRSNLQNFLEGAISCNVDTIWVARDLGYRGGRRTGVPLTDEVHLQAASRLCGGRTIERATLGPVVAERTAAVIWKVITCINRPVFLWNVFPFHPHEPGDSMSNRCHTRSEREACVPILNALFEMLNPNRIVAIGRDASLALLEMEIEVKPVRHPSYGGQNEFMNGVFDLYGVKPSQRNRVGTLFQEY